MTGLPMIFADYAGTLAAAGWEVGPLRGKVPLNTHGLTDFTTDIDTIRRWEREWPWANIGARVPRGLFVLDVDPYHGGNESLGRLEQVYAPLPPTLTVYSGRGDGGCHRYFQRPSGTLSSIRLPPGIDLRIRHYCTMPESIHPATGRPYRWAKPILEPAPCPGWLADLLRVEHHRQGGVQHHRQSGGDHRHLVQFVARQAEGNRNHGLYWAACRGAEAGVLDQLAGDLIDAAVRTGLNATEASRTVASARRCVA